MLGRLLLFMALGAGMFALMYGTIPAAHAGSHATLTAAVEAHVGSADGLRGRGTSPRILHVELLGSGDTALVEVGFNAQGRGLRLPLKVRRSGAGWELAWAPSAGYVEALMNLSRSETLPVCTSRQTWAEHQRLPSFPIIVTRQQVITPFGAMVFEESPDFTPPALLMRHVERWVKEVLEDAPGPASVDMIADGRVSWHGFNRVLLGVASMGLFRLHIITRSTASPELGVVSANIPVFASGIPRGLRILTVGLYPHRNQWAVRIATDDGPLVSESACVAGMSFCLGSAGEFAPHFHTRLATAKRVTTDFTHLMFATVGTTRLEAAFPFLEALIETVGFDEGKLFLGYIEK